MEKKEAGQAYISLHIDSAPLMRQADALRGRLQGVFDEVGVSAARRFTGRAESVRRAMEQWERQSGRLRDSFSELSGVMGQSFAMALTPAVTALNGFIGSILSAARTFRSFIFSLFGKKAEDTVAETASALDGVGSSAGGAGRRISAAAREARRALMAFDQINRLDEDTGSSGGSGSGGSGGMSIADLWGSGEELIQGNPFGELLRRMIEEGDYYGAGAALAAKLGEIVDILDGKITDPAFQNRLKSALSGIAEGINGFFDGMTFREGDKQTVAERLGDFVGDAMGLGLSSIHTLLSGIEWSGIGTSIAQFVNGGIASLRSQESNFGTVLADWINMKIGTLGGLFAELDWDEIGIYIGENINSLFEDIDWDAAAQAFVDGVTGLCDLIGSTIRTIEFADIVSDISAGLFHAIFGDEGEQWLREHPFWSKLLFGSDTPYIQDGAVEESKETLVDKLNGWFDELQDTVDSWFAEKGEGIVEFAVSVKNDAATWWANVKTWWNGKVSSVKEFTTNAKNQAAEWWENVKTWWNGKVGAVSDFTANLKNDASAWWAGAKTWWSNVSSDGLSISALVGLARNGWSTVNAWIREKFMGKDTNKGIGLFRNGWINLNNWIRTKFMGNDTNKGIGIFRNGWINLNNWIRTNFMGNDTNKGIGLFRNAWSTVNAWIRQYFMGGDTNKGIGIFRNAWSTVNAWIRENFMGADTNKGIGIFRDGWSTIRSWISDNFMGTTLSKGIGTFRDGWTTIRSWISDNFMGTTLGKAIGLLTDGWTTVAGWVSDRIGGYVEVGVSLFKSGWSSIKDFFGLSSGGIVGANGGVQIFGSGGVITRNAMKGWGIPAYAGGTSNAHGSMFVAGEAGPEIVGHIGGRTEVLNRSQLASTMHSAVISGMGSVLGNLAAWLTPPLVVVGRSVSRSEEHLASMDSQMRSGAAGGGPELMGLLRQIVTLIGEIDTNAYLDGRDVTDQVVKHLNARTRATGVCELIV